MFGDRPGGQLLNDLRLLPGADAIIAALAFALVEQRLADIVGAQLMRQLAAMRGGSSQLRSALLRRQRARFQQRQDHRARLNRVGGGNPQGFPPGPELD